MAQEFTGQWAILPAAVRYDKNLPANAKLIYAEIAAKVNEAGYCFCYNRHFSERFGLKPDTVSSLIKRLVDAGYIRVDIDGERVNSDRRHIYLTSKPYLFEGGIGFKSDTRPGFKSETVSGLNPGPIENINLKYNTPIVPEGDGSVKRKKKENKEAPDWKPERFYGFYEFYPKHRDKQAAIRAWDKLKPSDELIAVIGRALIRQKASPDWVRGIGIPYPSTYLNNQRWTDEPDSTGDAPTENPAPEVEVWS